MQLLLRWKSSKYCIFRVDIYRLGYLACKAFAPYCRLWPARLNDIFPHYLINGTTLERSFWTQNVYFDLHCSFCL